MIWCIQNSTYLTDKKIEVSVLFDVSSYLNVMKKYGLNYFYHFTNVLNLDSILKNGILSVNELNNRGIKYFCTDKDRLDQQLDYISLSLNTSNKSMLKYKKETINTEWIVFELDAESIIKKYYDKILYCKYNASAPSTIKILNENKEFMKSSVAFNNMFDDNNQPYFQAELLVPGIIGIEDINKIYVEHLQNKVLVELMLDMNNIKTIDVVIKREMF